ncbi:PAS-domain containing protein [Sphingomonas sp. SUN019]|uniref:sensor histidine kinase n=1 Tax=Sphingomonas sp. SUN019 TaxID=2937788 RepID=UPI0021647022|nr:PAS domain-containing sensor histidine kinase [Sphingomonas sp. SUN019]UVO49566.1 PAS-domain containing protein [Sphingomonas sp. SUN019]
MIEIGTTAAVLGGVVLALLIAAAGYALYRGLGAQAGAVEAVNDAARLQALLAAAPASALIVQPDGQIDMARPLADWLGLAGIPDSLRDLGGAEGLTSADLEGLRADVVAAQKAGRGFTRVAVPQGSARTLLMRGGRAPSAVGPGNVLVWVFDVTESEREILRLRQDQSTLREAFEALTGLIEAAPLPMWYRGPDLRLAMVNSAYVGAVEGSDAADVVARGVELVEGSGQGGPLAGAAAARERDGIEERVLPATIGGARRSLKLYDVPLPTGGVAGFAIDIEELEQAHVREKQFADAQRAMLDRLSAGVAQFGRDRAMVFCNQPFRRMFAMRSEWLADRPEFDRVLERMREANRVPEVRDFPGWKAERRDWFVRTDEQVEEAWHLPGGTHVRVVAQPLPDGGLLLIFEDRTEQVQLASARDTLLRVRTATFDNLFEALGVFAADGRLQLWNNRFRALWGLEEEFLSGHPRVDAVAEKVASKFASPGRAKYIAELVRSATVERQQRGGRVALADGRHFEFAVVPLPDGNALFTMLDISDSRRIERALREKADALEAADRVKTTFVANMSYELRTPLTSISGFAEMLHGGYAGKLTRQADSYVEAIMESVDRLSVLVDDVLDLTLLEADEGRIERTDVDLAVVAREAADGLRDSAERRKLDFAIDVTRSTGRLSGDTRRIREMIEHLLRHAIASTPEKGRVLLHTDGNATRARIVVSDDGAGMSAEAAAHAFDRFAQPGITSGGERALDLGLPLAKQFVAAHGGTIALVSEPGEGTLVTVELPRR